MSITKNKGDKDRVLASTNRGLKMVFFPVKAN